MIRFTKGDVLIADVEALVNTVNCVGIMGRGVALQFKNAYPRNFEAYSKACDRDEVEPGRMFVFETGRLTNPKYIINFPTKRHWKGKSRIGDIEVGLVALVSVIKDLEIHSVALPPLGSGLGGLNWIDVRIRIERSLAELDDVDVLVFEPGGGPSDDKKNYSSSVPRMTTGRASLIALMNRYLAGLMEPSISLLEVHKLLYFMQVAGEPLRLKFTKGPYGPYGENLRHVLRSIEGHLIVGYADGGDAPDKQLHVVPGAASDASEFLDEHPKTQSNLERVVKLVSGFETPFGLELLSTVHWVMSNDNPIDGDDLLQKIYAWGDRKKRFSSEQIGIAVERLEAEGLVRGQ